MDAYAIRKMVPRLVIGVIAINLSIYLCVAATDITRIIGDGIGQLMIKPFVDGGNFDFTVGDPNAINGALEAIGVAGLAAAAGAGTLIAVTGAVFANLNQFSSGEVMQFLIFTIVIPIALIALAVLATIVIRQGLLVFLIIVSPIAFALFILPSTEKYFRRWWDLFIRTLMVYPIIAIIFAMSKILSSIIFNSNQTLIGVLVGTIVMFLPLVMIPFSFRIAGGVMGQIYGAASATQKRINDSGFLKGRREHYGQKVSASLTNAKAQQYRSRLKAADNQTLTARQRRRAGRSANRLMGYKRDLLDKESELNIKEQERKARTTGAGDDLMERAYSADLKGADAQRAAAQAANPNARGGEDGDMWRVTDDGQLEVKTAGGKWVGRQAAVQARQKFGNRNLQAWTQSMEYEMGKATTQEEVDNIFQTFGSMADSENLSAGEANGIWIGAGFGKQNEQRQYKYHSWSRGDDGRMRASMNGLGIMREIDEKQGSYQSSMQQADTWTTLGKEVIEAKRVLDDTSGTVTDEQRATAQETLLRATRIVDSVRTRMPARDADGALIPGAPPIEEIGGGAAGHVKEEMRNFAKIVDTHAGEYVRPEGTLVTPASPPDPQPLRPVEDAVIDRNQAVPIGEERRSSLPGGPGGPAPTPGAGGGAGGGGAGGGAGGGGAGGGAGGGGAGGGAGGGGAGGGAGGGGAGGGAGGTSTSTTGGRVTYRPTPPASDGTGGTISLRGSNAPPVGGSSGDINLTKVYDGPYGDGTVRNGQKFDETKRIVYSDGAEHFYGVDAVTGKLEHTKGDKIIEAYGYDPADKPVKPGDEISPQTPQQPGDKE